MAEQGAITVEQLMAHSGWVRRLAGSLLRDDPAADDAAQEALLAGLRRPPDRRGSLRGWLGTVLVNGLRMRARGALRRAAREAAVGDAAQGPPPTPEEIVSGLEL